MNPTIQPGMHPDADMLNAFAEQLVTAEEREQMLAHMATCSRCREVMFLVQQASGTQALTAPAGGSEPRKKARGGWLGDWRWAWIPAGALAMLIGVVALLHFRRVETETEMARNAPSSNEALQQAAPPAPAANGAPAAPQPKAVEKAKAPAERDQALAKQKEERKALDEENRTARRETAAVSGLGVAPHMSISRGVVGGSVHGVMGARAKDSTYDGPAANQLQQNANQQNSIQQQNQLQSAQNLNEATANKPAAAGSGGGAGSVSETVTVQAEVVAPTSAAAPRPTPPTQLGYVPLDGKNFDVSAGAMAQFKKSAKVVLPGRRDALSSASAAGRTIAIDTSGALFLSVDNGKNWQPVTTQWTGRAVLVRTAPESGIAVADTAKVNADKVDRLKGLPEVKFELVTDKLQTWTSQDGKTWMAEVPPSK